MGILLKTEAHQLTRSSPAHLSHCSGITHPSLASKSRSWGPAYAPNADGRADALHVIPRGWSAGAQTLPPLSKA